MRIATATRLAAWPALAAVLVAVGGCGGGGGDSGSTGAQPAATGNVNHLGPAKTTPGQSTAPAKPSNAPHKPATSSITVPGNPKKAIPAAIEAVLAPPAPGPASAPTACGVFVTDRYIKTTYGTRQGCVGALVPGSAADSVNVSSVAVRGDRATARAVPRGGPSSGETITVSLVREASVWKVDTLRSNAPVGP